MTRLAYLPALFAALTISGGSTSHAPDTRPGAAARCRRRAAAEHRLDLERGHEPAPRRVRRPDRPHADAGSPRDPVDQVHPCVHDRAGVRAEPCRHHHGDVSDGDWGAAHAHHRRHGARAARAISGRPAVLRQGVPRVPARRRLLHQQPREDRLPVRDAFHDLGRSGRPGALAQSRRQVAAVLLGVQPGDHAREPDLSVEPGAQGQAARDRRGEDQGAALLPGQPRRPRRARADVRQHRRHGRPGRGDPPPAGGRRPGRQHHRVLLERSRRRRAARQALALRLRPARPADDSYSAASRCPRGAGYGQRRAGQLHRSCADGPRPRRGRRSRAHAGPRAGRAGEGDRRRPMSSRPAIGWMPNTT